MRKLDEDALICDLAETYGIFDYKRLPARRVASFAMGLRPNSRIKLRMSGASVDTNTLLLASAVDQLRLLVWSKTKDAEKGRNKPSSIAAMLTAPPAREGETYATGKDFEAARAALLKTKKGGQ